MSDDEMASSDQSSRLEEHPEDSTIKDMSRRDFIQASAAGLLTTVPHLSSSSGPSQRAPTPADIELCFMPATVLAAEIRAKRISPVEVIDAVYARLHEI